MSSKQFFLIKESKIKTYEQMWSFMINNPDVFVASSKEAVKKVKKGGYAYLLESTTNEYLRKRDCSLINIGGLLDDKVNMDPFNNFFKSENPVLI